MYENGLTNIYNDINSLHTLFGWDPVSGPILKLQLVKVETKSLALKSLGSLLEELLEELPVDLLTSLAVELVLTQDPALMAFLQKLREPGIAHSWTSFKALPETQELFQGLQDGGIDVNTIISVLEGFFGWGKLNYFSITLLDLELL